MRGMVRHLAALIFLGALLFNAASAPAQGRHVALVIGNGDYRAVPRLRNPVNDARLIARTLRGLGFTLVGGDAQIDLDQNKFERAVRRFGEMLPGAEIALFYYAGHGMQYQGANWLVPVDANPSRPQDLDFQMVDAELVLKQMQGAGTKLNVMILDACRNNPFGGRGLRGGEVGLAQMQAPEGTVISYATQPGNVAMDGAGADSPYTLALADSMPRPGLDVLRMFNRIGVEVKRATGGEQQPWVAASPIDGDYYFAGGSGAMVAALPPPPAPSPRVVAPVPPSNFSELADRIAAKAKPENIPLPQFFDFVAPGIDVPPEMARFVGAWGPGAWNGGPNHVIIVVDRVDATGAATVSLLQSAACADRDCTPSLRRPKVTLFLGKVEGGVLTFMTKDKFLREVLTIDADGRMHAVNYRGDATSRALLARIE